MHCLIVDDDPLICDLLSHFCSKVDAITSVTITNSGFESVNLISQKKFDLILLDYDLPDINGKEILELIHTDSSVIMITANKTFASESYAYEHVVDYLVKPIDFARFVKAIQKAQKYVQLNAGTTEGLFVKDGNRLVKVRIDQVLFVKSAANYVEIILPEKKLMTLMTLKELKNKLPSYFQQVHRSFIVNVNKIDSISGGELVVGQEEIPISERYQQELLNQINLLN